MRATHNRMTIVFRRRLQIATADNPNVAGERIVLQPNQRLIIVDPVTGILNICEQKAFGVKFARTNRFIFHILKNWHF